MNKVLEQKYIYQIAISKMGIFAIETNEMYAISGKLIQWHGSKFIDFNKL